MDIDHATIKAVSAESRKNLLKSLKARKKMPSELSKETGLSPSTIVGHLQSLQTAGLIRRVETGHKWVYYELTDKGSNIVQPKVPMQFALALLLGVAMTAFGFLRYLSIGSLSGSVQKSAASEAIQSVGSGAAPMADTGISAVSGAPPDWQYVLMMIAGLVIITLGAYKLLKKDKVLEEIN